MENWEHLSVHSVEGYCAAYRFGVTLDKKQFVTSKVTIEFDPASVCGIVKVTDPASKEFEFHFKKWQVIEGELNFYKEL
jgi:hypothetical protein